VFAAECADLPPLPLSPARNVSIAPGNITAGANTQGYVTFHCSYHSTFLNLWCATILSGQSQSLWMISRP